MVGVVDIDYHRHRVQEWDYVARNLKAAIEEDTHPRSSPAQETDVGHFKSQACLLEDLGRLIGRSEMTQHLMHHFVQG